METGESMPVHKKEGDEVIWATVNTTGSFEMQATKVGAETTLATIIALVKKAQRSKAPVQKLVDYVSSIFVPAVIVLSIITFFVWLFFGPAPVFLHALIAMISVLIIACPCALGLATPTSIMVGMGRGAQEGILIKDVQTLERACFIDTIVFDKTGTLTVGKPAMHDFKSEENMISIFKHLDWSVPDNVDAGEYMLALIVGIESLSNHPISKAVVEFLQKKSPLLQTVLVEKFETVSGLGVRALVDGHTVVVGSRQLMEQEGVTLTSDVDACALRWSQQAKSVSFVAFNTTVVAHFCVADALRPEALATIKTLKTMGIRSVMLTGDNELSAQAVATQLGIDDYFARVLPADKKLKVSELQKKGFVVAMVGDGINDAPALAIADVGIAMGGGADVALETAGVALLRNDISLVPKMITLSQATMSNIKQNLFWAFAYNILLIPVAMGILYPLFGITLNPMLAGFSMAFSSLSVVFNALRLRNVVL